MTDKKEMTDETNPAYLFNGTHSELLCKIAKGEINAKHLAHRQLANRGMNSNGKWVTFPEAKAEASEAIMNLRPSLQEMDAARRTIQNGILYGGQQNMLKVKESYEFMELLTKWSLGYDSWKKGNTANLQAQIQEL